MSLSLTSPISPVPSRNEEGMNTAEYAVGTVSACGFAGVLFQLLTTGVGERIITTILDKVTGMLPF